MARRPDITSRSSWRAIRPSAPGRGWRSTSRSIPAVRAAAAGSTPKKPPTISPSELVHRAGERRQPSGEAFLLEEVDPAPAFLGRAIEGGRPFDECLAAFDDRRHAKRGNIV